MSGFEHQVAGHMLWENMVMEGLAVERAIHDRYDGSKRNPWNEVECGDHYARAMASDGVFIAACGFEYHGPNGHLGFAPRLTPEDFRAAFTAAEGWGSFHQRTTGEAFHAAIEMRRGRLALRTLSLTPPDGMKPAKVAVTLAGNPLATTFTRTDGPVEITFAEGVEIPEGGILEVVMA